MYPQSNVGIAGHGIDEEDINDTPADLERPPELEKHILGFKELTILPYGGLSENGPYEFQVGSMSSYYPDLSSVRFKGKVKIKKIVKSGRNFRCQNLHVELQVPKIRKMRIQK